MRLHAAHVALDEHAPLGAGKAKRGAGVNGGELGAGVAEQKGVSRQSQGALPPKPTRSGPKPAALLDGGGLVVPALA